MHIPHKEKGIILVTALWIMMLISVMAVLITYKTKLQLQLAAEALDATETKYFAQGLVFMT